MRCRYCGQRIPEGELYCRHCGKEVRIVPDYNPLDDMLTAQIKGAIDGDEDIYNDSYTTRSTRNRNNRNATFLSRCVLTYVILLIRLQSHLRDRPPFFFFPFFERPYLIFFHQDLSSIAITITDISTLCNYFFFQLEFIHYIST